MSKKVKLQGNIDVAFELQTEQLDLESVKHKHTYLLDSVLIESVNVILTIVSGDVIELKALDWDVLLSEDGDLE